MDMHKASNTKWTFIEITFLSLCLFSNEADSHILIYQTHSNQLIEEYNDLPAQFGPSIPPNGLKVFAVPVQPTSYGCDKISPPPVRPPFYPHNAKTVALIQRGGREGCTFELKVRQAQLAGYDAVIVYNDKGDDLEQMSAENSSGIYISSVFVGHTTGMNLMTFFSPDVVLLINDELPFNINTQLILPFSILIGMCFLVMIFYMIYKCIRDERRLRRCRLPKSMLKKLPILKYTKNNDLSYETCVICLDDFVEGDKVRVLPCKHPYHTHCIDPWLTQNRRVCPICKRKVFTKGVARTNRNPQSSLDSVTDTDDDTTPLLQPGSSDSIGTAVAAVAATTHHGTFRREGNATVASDASSDDENALLAQQLPSRNSRRVNPFDRTPNLPSHLAEQLNENRSSTWSRILSFFVRQQSISVAAPPYPPVTVTVDATAVLPAVAAAATSLVAAASLPCPIAQSAASSNNILNPNLSGSFKDDDELPHQSIYEPIAMVTPINSTTDAVATQIDVAEIPDTDSVFIEAPTQGGIGVVALPNPNGRPTGLMRQPRDAATISNSQFLV